MQREHVALLVDSYARVDQGLYARECDWDFINLQIAQPGEPKKGADAEPNARLNDGQMREFPHINSGRQKNFRYFAIVGPNLARDIAAKCMQFGREFPCPSREFGRFQ